MELVLERGASMDGGMVPADPPRPCPPNGPELSRPGQAAASILARQSLETRQGFALPSAKPPQVRVLATSAGPASILARRVRVGSSELLGGILWATLL